MYYFLNEHNKVIYVGMAKNVQQRVKSHFTGHKTSKQRIAFLRNIFNIHYKVCVNELVAAIFESIEIKRLWPPLNKSQKFYEHKYGIYSYLDNAGYHRLCIDKKKRHLQAIALFHSLTEARVTLETWITDFDLHPVLCGFASNSEVALPATSTHNQLLQTIINKQQEVHKTFLLEVAANFYLYLKNGQFVGMGNLNKHVIELADIPFIEYHIDLYPNNSVAQKLAILYKEEHPSKTIALT